MLHFPWLYQRLPNSPPPLTWTMAYTKPLSNKLKRAELNEGQYCCRKSHNRKLRLDFRLS